MDTWTGIYPAHLDGYGLYDQLDTGDPVNVTVRGVTYRMQFQGVRFGGMNWLEVMSQDGEERKYGRGWESVQVFEALEEMQKGWATPQRYKYRQMDRSGD